MGLLTKSKLFEPGKTGLKVRGHEDRRLLTIDPYETFVTDRFAGHSFEP